MEHSVEKTLLAMIHHDAGDPERIHHFLKVHNFARLIGLGENLDERTQYLVETIAAVHDIGIHQAEKVYGSSAGKYQEELGPAEADEMLTALGLPRDIIDRVMYLVAHHHTYTDIDGIDYQILVEADFLVNLYENALPVSAQKQAYESIFKTETGKHLCRELFPGVVL